MSNVRETLIMFPGQGPQTEVPEIAELLRDDKESLAIYKSTFREADDILAADYAQDNVSWRLQDLGFRPSLENTVILSTDSAAIQTLLHTAEVALLRIHNTSWEESAGFVMGHSLGEYAAFVAAGYLDFEHSLPLVYERARAMEISAKSRNVDDEGGMLAVSGLDEDAIQRDLAENNDSDTEIVNYNALIKRPQLVLSGLKKNLIAASTRHEKIEKVRVNLLNIPGAFHHSVHGHQAAERLQSRIRERGITFQDQKIMEMLSNRNVYINSAQQAGDQAVNSLRRGVLWAQSSAHLIEIEGVKIITELGPGNVLSRITDREFKGKVVVKSLSDRIKARRRA